MAKVKLDPIFAGISGTLGDIVFRTSKNGETIISMRPRKSSVPPSEAQHAQRDRLKQAHEYPRPPWQTRLCMPSYEERAAKEGKSPYKMAHADYLNGKDLFSSQNQPGRS